MKPSEAITASPTRSPTFRTVASSTPKPNPAIARMVSQRLIWRSTSATATGSSPTLRAAASSRNIATNQGR